MRLLSSCRNLFFLLLVSGCIFSSIALAAEGTEQPPERNPQETLNELSTLLRRKKFSFEEIRTINEAMSRIREQMQKKSLSEDAAYYTGELRETLLRQLEKAPGERILSMLTARFFLFLNEPQSTLRLLKNIGPASDEDIEWPYLAAGAYLQLGNYQKAGMYAGQMDMLLRKRSPLLLSTPVAVKQVTAYRLYSKRDEVSFKPGETLILYLEINGAKFSPVRNEGFKCRLDFGLELRDAVQNVVDRNANYGRYDPSYAGPIKELHATIYYRLPPGLKEGRYFLVVTCKDGLTGSVSDTDFVFDVGNSTKPRIPRKLQTEKKSDADVYKGMVIDKDLRKILDDKLPGETVSPEDLKRKASEMQFERSKKQGGLLNQ